MPAGRGSGCGNRRICAISSRRRRSRRAAHSAVLRRRGPRRAATPIAGLGGDNARHGEAAALDVDRARSRRRRAALPAVRGASREIGSGACGFDHARARRRRDQEALRRRAASLGGHLPVLVHRRTATARCSTTRGEIDLGPTLDALARYGGGGRRCRRRRRQPERHDGRPHGAHARGARRGRSRARADHELQHEVREPVLRSVPRRGGFGAAVRRSTSLPDRRAVAPRRDRVERPLRGRGRGPADGQAGHDVARSDRADRGGDRQAGRRVSGERRVRGLARARRARLLRFRRGAARNLARVPSRRRGVHHHVRRAARGARSDWHERARGLFDRALPDRAGRRAQPGARVPRRRRHAGLLRVARRARVSSTSTASSYIDFCHELRPADPRPRRSRRGRAPCTRRSTTAGRSARASRTRSSWPSGSPRACRGSSGSASSRPAPRR